MDKMTKPRHRPPKDPIAQLRALAHVYLRQGGKQSRRKRLARLETAVKAVTVQFHNNDLRQIGKRHVQWFYGELTQQELSAKTIAEYHYAWCLLWELLCKLGSPPRPKTLSQDSTRPTEPECPI